MIFENKFHVALFVYACLTILLFVHQLPLIYTGYSPHHDDPMLRNPTVLDDPQITYEQYAPPTRLALWFAGQRNMRMALTVALLLFMIIVHLSRIQMIWKRVICLSVMWLGLVVFIINYLGLLFFLIR